MNLSGQQNLVAFLEHHLEQGAQGGSGSIPDPDASQAVSGPSMYPVTTVFMETLTRESFSYTQNTSAAARSGSKRRSRLRASANSRALGKDATSIEELKMAKKQKTQRGKRHIRKGQDTEPSEIQAGPSGTRDSEPEVPEIEPVYSFYHDVSDNIFYQLASSQTPAPLATDQVHLVNLAAADLAHSTQLVAPFTDESHLHAEAFYSNAPIYQHVRFDGHQAVNQDPLGELDFATSGGYDWQPQPSQFDANNLTSNITSEEFFNFLNSVERNLEYDSVQQALYVQALGSNSGFSGSLAGDFTGLPSWELN